MKNFNSIISLSIILLCGINCSKEKKSVEITRNYNVDDVTGKVKELETTSQVSLPTIQSEPAIDTANIKPETLNLKPDLTLKNLLPDLKNHPNFKLTKEPEFFVGNNLYEYIDGGDELFHSYDFRQIITAEYQSKSNPDLSIVVDIYDMTTPDNAFGVFSAQKDLSSNFVNIGIQGISGGGEIVFIKDKYYNKLTTFVDTQESNETLKKFALEVADKIKGIDKIPEIFKIFPQEGMIKNSEGFILRNAFGCPEFNQVFIANYEINNEKIWLAVSQNQSAEKAKIEFKKLKEFFIDTTKNEQSVTKIGDDSFIGKNKKDKKILVSMKNEKLVCVIGYKEIKNAQNLIEQILSRI